MSPRVDKHTTQKINTNNVFNYSQFWGYMISISVYIYYLFLCSDLLYIFTYLRLHGKV